MRMIFYPLLTTYFLFYFLKLAELFKDQRYTILPWKCGLFKFKILIYTSSCVWSADWPHYIHFCPPMTYWLNFSQLERRHLPCWAWSLVLCHLFLIIDL